MEKIGERGGRKGEGVLIGVPEGRGMEGERGGNGGSYLGPLKY